MSLNKSCASATDEGVIHWWKKEHLLFMEYGEPDNIMPLLILK